jgi:hypothetical protein
VPPWQHNDEPTHFEYAALIYSQNSIPEPGQFDQSLRREIASSMIEHHFFDDLDFQPNLDSSGEPIWIGLSQLEGLPSYYIIAGLPLLLVQSFDVTTQLYFLRFISLLMYLATVGISYAIVREMTPQNHPLRWLVPLILILVPAFTDLMTAVNDDVGAVLIFSIFLWLGIRIIQKGYSLGRVSAFIIVTLLCVGVKTTIWVAIPMSIFLVVPFLLRKSAGWKWATGLLILGIIFILAIATLSWQDADNWIRLSWVHPSTEPTKIESDQAQQGNHVLHVQILPEGKGQPLFQLIPPDIVQQIRGQTVTLGAWIWSDKPVQLPLFEIWVDGKRTSQELHIDREPTFISFPAKISPNAQLVQVNIIPILKGVEQPISIYIDGLIFLEGDWPQTGNPVFDDNTANSGVWNGRHFNNLARNASFETSWLTIRPEIASLFYRRMKIINPSYLIASIQDLRISQGIYKSVFTNLFQSFWARFGWNHIRLTSRWYWGLAILSIAGIAGSLYFLVSHYKKGIDLSSRRLLSAGWLLIGLFFIWIGAILRTDFPFWGDRTFIPGARYAYPAVIPTILVFSVGWYWLSRKLTQKWIGILLVIISLIILDVFSLLTIYNFYQGG